MALSPLLRQAVRPRPLSSSTRPSFPRPTDCQPLEARRLCSVTVTETWTGFYEIHGDGDANTIDVAVSMQNETMTVDGVTYAGVQFISVYAGEGDDTVSLLTTDGPGWIGATIDGSGGNDTITLNFDGSVWAGQGDDTVNLSDSFRGEARGEGGADTMTISGECIDPEIVGGDGNDVIDASANHYGVVIHGGSGDDTLIGSAYDDELYAGDGADTLYGNGGNDQFYTSGDATWDMVSGGDGDDTLWGDLTDLVGDESVEMTYLS